MENITTGASALLASDLIIEIQPRWKCRFRGSAAQLIAEGLIPEGFKWPARTRRECWESGNFNYCVERRRPVGHKGPMSTWSDGDFWVLDVYIKGCCGFSAHLIHEKTRELNEIIRGMSLEWSRTCGLAHQAKQDNKYMTFRTQLFGDMVSRKRGRPAKNTTTTQHLGASE